MNLNVSFRYMRKSTKESINDSVSPKKLKNVILVILPKREWGGMGGGGERDNGPILYATLKKMEISSANYNYLPILFSS